MKRFSHHYFTYALSWLLLIAVGVINATAQSNLKVNLLETEKEVTSQDVLLYSQGKSGTGYLYGTGTYSTLPSPYRFEATGETIEGHHIYRLKQVYTGLYVKDYQLDISTDETDSSCGSFASGDYIDMTPLASEALKVTVTIAKEDSDDPYAGATSYNGYQDLSYTAFVIRRAELVKGEVQYFGHYIKPFHSIYRDTNAWHIYSIPAGRDMVLAYINYYYGDSNTDPATVYPIGTTPGSYKASYVNSAHQVWQAAFDALHLDDQFPLTDEQANELCARIVSTSEALQAKDAYNPITPGYYFINSTAGRYLYGASQSANDFVYAGKAGEDINTSVVTIDNLKYLWRVTDTYVNDRFAIQNVIYGKNLGGESVKADPAGNSGYGFTLADGATVAIVKGTAKDNDGNVVDNMGFNITNPTRDGGNSQTDYHAKYDNRPLEGWNEKSSINNCFTFTPVETDEIVIAALLAQDKQNKLNETLNTTLATALALYNDGIDYRPAEGFTYTNDFSEEGKLVSPGEGDDDAAKEANSHWYSNKKQEGDGTYEALVDNNPDTFFHSNWVEEEFTPSITKNHYLVATLDAPVSGDIMVKMAKRMRGNDFPLQVAIYGTNEFDKAKADDTQWIFQGLSNISWSDLVEISGMDGSTYKTIPDGVGAAYMHLDGSYKYIKIAATKTVFNFDSDAAYNADGFHFDRGYFSLSEMNIWPVTGLTTSISPDYREAIKKDPNAYAELSEEISHATAQLAAGKATQEQIDILTDAINYFKSLLPVPSQIVDAYTEAKAFFDEVDNKGLVGTELGQYSQETADALRSVLKKYENVYKVYIINISTAVSEINTAFFAFKASLRLPEAGKYYTIRSASKKVVPASYNWLYGYQGTINNAMVYSANNNSSVSPSDADNAIRFTFAHHSSEVTTTDELYKLSDSISLRDDASYVWKAEAAQDGKMMLRNLATGMYLTGDNGKIYQSTEATPILGEGVKANVFRFNLGKDDNDVTQYMSTKGSTGTIVSWRYADDENSYWQFNELKENEFTTQSFTIKGVKQGDFYAATFPVSVNAYGNATLYTVLGVNEAKDKLVLAEVVGDVSAGKPVILRANVVSNNGGGTMGSVTVGCEDLSSAEYVFEPSACDGLIGTICEPIEIAESFGHFDNGRVVTGTYTVPCNSAYLAYATVTSAEGEASIELSKDFGGILTGIDSDKVLILPSIVSVYDVNGQLVKKNVKAADAKKDLPVGVYVINGQKVYIK